MSNAYHRLIEEIVEGIQPLDKLESNHQADVLNWIRSGLPLCRIRKPDFPPKHLVSYFSLFDSQTKQLLLVDHKKARLWLPPGGHVESGENPSDAAKRELQEELGVDLPFYFENPLFVTVTETVGVTKGHVDVSLWYVFNANSRDEYNFDRTEFNSIKWFSLEELPLGKTDPHLERFCKKLNHLGFATCLGSDSQMLAP